MDENSNSENTFKYFAITANCGNDTIGEKASSHIVKEVISKNPDFVVINCQEVDFEKTKAQLKAFLSQNSEYEVTLLGKMVTHTKLDTQFHNNTGIGTFIIHKKTLKVTEGKPPILARRGKHGSSFNKGGLVNNISISSKANPSNSVKLKTMSGHLDSSNVSKRTKDWGVIHRAIVEESVTDWETLEKAMPNIQISGYDANTRNNYNKGSAPVNIWESGNSDELRGLVQAPLGGIRYSKDSTYKTSKRNITTVEDEKRPGKTRGGMLDFVDVMSDSMNKLSEAITKGEDVFSIGSGKDVDPMTGRDHDVIISPVQTYEVKPNNSFERVKNSMVIRLEKCAPSLASQIREFKENDSNKARLVSMYNNYLSKEGFLNKQLEIHAKTLGIIQRIDDDYQLLNIKPVLLKQEPWLEGPIEEIEARQEFQNQILIALDACKTPADFNRVEIASKNADTFDENIKDIIERKNKGMCQDIFDKSSALYQNIKAGLSSTSKFFEPKERSNSICRRLSAFCDQIASIKESIALSSLNTTQKDLVTSFLESMMKAAQACILQLSNIVSMNANQVDSSSDKVSKNTKIAQYVDLFLTQTSSCLHKISSLVSATQVFSNFKKQVSDVVSSKTTESFDTDPKHTNDNRP